MVVIATAGHVDHGKSTLIRRLTGTDPDRWEEERRRGLTIDLGFAEMSLASGRVVEFIDVPGHGRFIKNMLAGVGSVAGCLFVVAADEGWKAQSEEHLRILELLDVQQGIVVLTKAGRADAELLELAHLDVAEHLAGTRLATWPVVTVDAVEDLGITDLETAIERLAGQLPDPPDLTRPRLWIDRSFAIPGAGAVVTGTLNGGSISVGEEISAVTPTATLSTRIRAIQSFGRGVTTALPGSRVAVNLAAMHHRDLRRGDALVHAGQWHLTRRFDATLTILASCDRPVSQRAAAVIHVGSEEVPARLQFLLGSKEIEPGSSGCVRISLPRSIPLLPGDRYVLRDLSRRVTVGGGEVLDVDPRLSTSRARPDRSVERTIRERGWIGVDELERITGERRVPTLGTGVADPAWEVAARSALKDRVDAAGVIGLDLALLDDHERRILPSMPDLKAAHGRIRRPDAAALAEDSAKPIIDALDAAPFEPPSRDELGLSPALLRDLKQQGRIVEQDGILFSATAIERAAHLVAALLADQPDGVAVSEIRSALGTSRKWALPLIKLLDSNGFTRRSGDLRIGGPRLPPHA